ncbi:MAG: hypothetical protein J7518_21010 [Nocardioidaceae bacterium]|nr:hypothetical protein [Nocardioidaceae bacterium]
MTTTVRRAAAVLVVVVGLEVLVVAGHGTPWRGEWNWTLDHLVGTTVLTGPAVGAFAAWLAAGERSRATLNDGAFRGWMVPARMAAVAALTGLAGFALGLVAGLLATATVPHGGPFAGWFLAIVPLLLACYAALGAIAGHLWPQRIVVVLVAPALFLLGTAAALGIGPNVLRQGPTTGSLAGTTWDAGVVAFQELCLLGVTLAALVVPAVLLGVAPKVARGVLAGALALAVVGVAGLEVGGDYSFVSSGERPSACAERAPRVCLAPSHRRSLGPVAGQLQRVGAVLADAGAAVPATYVEEIPGYRGSPGSGLVILPAHANVDRYPLFAASHAIALPAPCPAWSAEKPPPESAFAARELIASWVQTRLGNDQPPVFSPEAGAWLRSAPAATQQDWVVAAFDALRSCRLDQIRLPWDE